MFLSGTEQRALATCFSLLAEDLNEREIRERMGQATLALFRADHFASYIWSAPSGCFAHPVAVNMDPANLQRYEAWYQYRDPITFALQSRRHATLVSEVMPRKAFLQTEFFNDFLARDGLYWGINLHAFDGDEALGDLRIWRGRSGNEFTAHDKQLLDLIAPAFVAALRRARRSLPAPLDCLPAVPLSRREMEVARCVCRGLTDKEIARELAIALPSVRTYLQRLFDKLGVHRRAGLAQLADRLH
ncbi:MAG: helix-turn-helix transcriptional regulator [Polaromonas sp.]|uniref:helix-turn-helix transcriptional regulator n=1 Tax=Polaromonas sp. TaxID=1869339 RepID=UPI002486E42C|nr:helix-turn-helix transcriptional regulator [Polaromonas sp.]MDI1239268.1 helix-turn-helix transcriptional regulator [Polaromonas sp.]